MTEHPSTGQPPALEERTTRGVGILRGDPRVAIRKLSGPMIVAMFLMAIYGAVALTLIGLALTPVVRGWLRTP